MDGRTQGVLRLLRRRSSIYIVVSALVVSLIVSVAMSVMFLRLQGKSMQSGLNGVVAGVLATTADMSDPEFTSALNSDLGSLTRLGQFAFLAVKAPDGAILGSAGDNTALAQPSLDERELKAVTEGHLYAYISRCSCGELEFMVVAPLTSAQGGPPYAVVRGHRDIVLVAPFLLQMTLGIVFVVMAGAVISLILLRALVDRAEDELENDRQTIAVLDHRLETSLESLTSHAVGTMQALVAAVDARDTYTAHHSMNVSDCAIAIAERMGLADQAGAIERAGLLHDIGKIGVSEYALLKPGALTDAEFDSIKQHPAIGASIVQTVPFLSDLADVIRHHHERWDGTGYPDGLKGEEIPLLARVLSVADALDAMTSNRSYRYALTPTQARREIAAGRGTQFDPQVADAALELLDDGEYAQLRRPHREFSLAAQPVISPEI